MPDYAMSLRSSRSTFAIGFAAENDEAAIEHAIGLAAKARAPVGSNVLIVKPDGTEIDVSDTAAPRLDRPDF